MASTSHKQVSGRNKTPEEERGWMHSESEGECGKARIPRAMRNVERNHEWEAYFERGHGTSSTGILSLIVNSNILILFLSIVNTYIQNLRTNSNVLTILYCN